MENRVETPKAKAWQKTTEHTDIYFIKDGEELHARGEVTLNGREIQVIKLWYRAGDPGVRPLRLLKQLIDQLEKEGYKIVLEDLSVE